MTTDTPEKIPNIFIPYYINQSRLLDLYAILNGGYSEYEEITTGNSSEKKGSTIANGTAHGGFRIVNIGVKVTGGKESSIKDAVDTENKEKKVQTITSILNIVQNDLHNNQYLHEIEDAKPGDFVLLPITLKINSIKHLVSEISTLLDVQSTLFKSNGSKGKSKSTTPNVSQIMDVLQGIFDEEEVIFETEKYAVFGNIVDDNLYLSNKCDILDRELYCLAQVMRVFPHGTELMRNTIFYKIQDNKIKSPLMSAISSVSQNAGFNFEAAFTSEISDKTVYQLEIIALYR